MLMFVDISKICAVDDLEAIGSFFKGFTLPVKGQTSNGVSTS